MVADLLGINNSLDEYKNQSSRDIHFRWNGSPLMRASIEFRIKHENFGLLFAYIGGIWLSTIVLLHGVFKSSIYSLKAYTALFMTQLFALLLWNLDDAQSRYYDIGLKFLLILYYSFDVILSCVIVIFTGYLRDEAIFAKTGYKAIPSNI